MFLFLELKNPAFSLSEGSPHPAPKTPFPYLLIGHRGLSVYLHSKVNELIPSAARAPPSRRSKKEHRFDAHGEAAQVVINPSGEKFNSTTGGAYEKG